MAPPFACGLCVFSSCFHGDEMTTQGFKKGIYEVKVNTYFVLKPSNEIENQILVSYLNLF